MRILFKILPLLLVFFSLSTANAKDKYIFVITIDGLRPDAISETNTPSLSNLLQKSSYSLNASTVFPSSTMPSHTSLFTGLDAKNHKNTLNEHKKIRKLISQGKYLQFDTIFTIGEKNGFRTTFICGKDKLKFLIRPSLQNTVLCHDIYDNKDNIVPIITTTFTSSFKTNRNKINFIHYPEPDLSGHRNGWMTEKYLESLRSVDKEIEKLLGLIRTEMAEKESLLIITADHGGTEKTHGTRSKEHMTIPWIAYGNSVKKNHKIKKEVKIYDTAPTILNFLGIKTPPNLDGKAVTEIFN
ncbi:MAG: sulfatase-like hydrolase/transferase [Candidatus Dadabacteria bacterium]|nr:sulfatase-like hydrolase/transferase [Candidatus Dadabacteria bacterium]NIS08215.1 sulfatase-like hydrolase/transferase [Candidatus Dadabacteria bacterium]NIV41482.1 sulfatase-like hydrolase/transferase [Candidatus Dadabacteria bacterium]NIX15125.1 sulfatase-like hydrolase/transferase [Candidatus Dadabacteria bacterium]NIY21703.1 sulfatase-like hydrolase/transferase [Candidatus Dadabacteria bacterium]